MAASGREIAETSYLPSGDPGSIGGGTYTNTTHDGGPTIRDYENIFGPAARDVKLDMQRNKRHARWHLPDALKGSNPWLADRIDGLITDTTGSPFTTKILPYKYIENVDQKIKWNAWSFDEGLASRVPYESAARTLTQTKRSYAGYTIRQGLAITMEHNFMMSDKGRENFKHQLQQIVGSIQYTNDIDVHMALITAPSYAKERAEKFHTQSKTNHQAIREYIDLFGFMSKNPNAMDIMIEEGKSTLRLWGAKEPDFLLTNSRLTFQMTMIPEKTSYMTQGVDGVRLLKDGPNISSYRGLNIINTRSFSLEDGAPPRDVLNRRVRVAEYYRIPWEANIHTKHFSFYDEAKDSWQKFSWWDLVQKSGMMENDIENAITNLMDEDKWGAMQIETHPEFLRFRGAYEDALVKATTTVTTDPAWQAQAPETIKEAIQIVIIRPNIEHNMMGIIIGRGGIDDLGATLWGQTELSVYDDSMHGIWGMSYKYNERAIVFNQKNLVRLWDVAYAGYNGGKDTTHLDWDNNGKKSTFTEDTANMNKPYEGASMMVMSFPKCATSFTWPSPVIFHQDPEAQDDSTMVIGAESDCKVSRENFSVFNNARYSQKYKYYFENMPDFTRAHAQRTAGHLSEDNETACNCLAFQGTYRTHHNDTNGTVFEVTGNGHHGQDFVGVASIRAGKGVRVTPSGSLAMTHAI